MAVKEQCWWTVPLFTLKRPSWKSNFHAQTWCRILTYCTTHSMLVIQCVMGRYTGWVTTECKESCLWLSFLSLFLFKFLLWSVKIGDQSSHFYLVFPLWLHMMTNASVLFPYLSWQKSPSQHPVWSITGLVYAVNRGFYKLWKLSRIETFAWTEAQIFIIVITICNIV